MILLEPANRILEETLLDRFNSEKEEKLLVNACDFDGCSYRISTPNSKSVLVLSMRWSCFHQLEPYSVKSVLSREYGHFLLPSPEHGFDVSLQIDLSQIPQDQEQKGL